MEMALLWVAERLEELTNISRSMPVRAITFETILCTETFGSTNIEVLASVV
jgi:hypothetical protein